MPFHTGGAPKAAPMPGMVTVAAPGGGGGYFSFTEDEFQSVITEWEEILDDLVSAAHTAAPMARVRSMGNEPSSKFVMLRANHSGEAYLRHNRQSQQFVKSFIAKLKDAQKSYQAQDEAVADQFGAIQRNLEG